METKKCQVCFNEIQFEARKCQYCLEWIETKDESEIETQSENIKINFRDKFSNAKIPFQLGLLKKIPLHYLVSIIIICTILFAIIQVSWYNLNEDNIYLFSFLAGIIQLIITWSGIIWIYDIINKNYQSTIEISAYDEVEAEKRFTKAHGEIFNSKYAILFGIIVGLMASLGDYIIGTPFKTEQAKFIFAGFEFINMFFAGAAIYSMIKFAYFLDKIRIDSDSDFLSLEKNLAIHNIGKIHLKSSLLAVVPLFLGVCIKLFGDWNWDILVVIWYVSFAIGIVIYIYWPIQNIHNLMQANIDSQIGMIQAKRQKILLDINNNPSSRNFSKLHELGSLEDSISSQSSWPFDTKSISAIFMAIILPIILMIIDRVMDF